MIDYGLRGEVWVATELLHDVRLGVVNHYVDTELAQLRQLEGLLHKDLLALTFHLLDTSLVVLGTSHL